MVLSGLTSLRSAISTVFVLVCLVPLAGVRAQTAEIAGTMPEDSLPSLKAILAVALRQSPEMISREFERQAQEARLYGADAPRLPQVGGSFRYGMTQTATSSNSSSQSKDNGFFYDFGVSQAVFHWGALKNQSAIARIGLLVTDKSYALAYREISVLLRQSYLALIVEKSKVRAAREGQRILKTELAVTEEKMRQGVISSAAFEGDKLKERELALEVARAEADFAANRRRFSRIAGLLEKEFTEDVIPNEIPAPPKQLVDLATALTATLLRDGAKMTLEYEIYDLRVRESLLRYKIERTRLLPKITANAGMSLENNTNVNGNSVQQSAVTRQSVSIGGQWNIFDGLATRGAIREALIARRASEQKLATETERVLQTAQTLERSLKLDAEQIALVEIRRGMAEEAKRRILEESTLGNLAKNDAERADIGIYTAETNNLAARAAFLAHWSELVAITGHDPVLNTLPVRYAREKK